MSVPEIPWLPLSALPFEIQIQQATKSLQHPAGDDTRYSSLEGIRQHQREFVIACHRTWKYWHDEAVRQIMMLEELKRAQKGVLGQQPGDFDYLPAVWRRVSDAIVWSFAGYRRHIVKRLCLYRRRNYLRDSNAHSVLPVIARLNENPLSLAIWNDATSCVDLGDVTYIEDGTNPILDFRELKDGEVNREILELLASPVLERDARLQAFLEARGSRGLEQYERVLRQKEIAESLHSFLATGSGVDPVTGRSIHVFNTGVEPRHYDAVLQRVLVEALELRSQVTELVSECIWICANGDPTAPAVRVEETFRSSLDARVDRSYVVSSKSARKSHDQDVPVPLTASFRQPLAMPLFIRQLSPNVVGAVVAGRLTVFLYFDWNRFAGVVAACGGQLTHGTRKEINRAKSSPLESRPVLVSGRLPVVQVGSARHPISGPNLIEMLFDGTTPSTIARRIIASARDIGKAADWL